VLILPFVRPRAVLSESLALDLAAALPASSLVALPIALVRGSGRDPTAWVFTAFSVFFVGMFAYAFARAASAQRVLVRRVDTRLTVRTRSGEHAVPAHAAVLGVTREEHGSARRITLYRVSLRTVPEAPLATLHLGFTRTGAERAERRIAVALGIPGSSVAAAA
jgi:hypothetical protein